MTKKAALFEVIEEIGFGPFHVLTFIVCGCAWLAIGTELTLITSVAKAVGQELHLDPLGRALMVTIMFLGVLIGNLLSGSLGDNYGRRIVIIVSCVGIIVFTIISSFAQSAITLTAARLFVGAALGIGQPGIYSLASELTPIWWRFASSSVWQSSYCCGALYSALLLLYDDPDLQHLHWRWLLRMGTIPAAACLIMSMFFLYQSPSFLATNGHYDEAVKVLDAMKWFNSASSVSSEFTPPPPNVDSSLWENSGKQASIVLGHQMLWSTIVAVFSCFTANFIYFGCMYAFPLLLPNVFRHTSAAFALFVGGLWELVGYMLGLIIGNWFTRKQALKIYLGGTVLSILIFNCASLVDKGSVAPQIALYVGCYGIRAVSAFGFVAIYQYVTEIYPTQARNTGSAFSFAGGRLGAMLAPIMYECLQNAFQSFAAFFFFAAACACLNFLLIDTLPFETAGTLLADNEPLYQDPVQTEQHQHGAACPRVVDSYAT